MRRVLIGLLALPLLAMAAPPADYATQWPLRLEQADAGAYRVELDASVYRQHRTLGIQHRQVAQVGGLQLPVHRGIQFDPVRTRIGLFEPQRPLRREIGRWRGHREQWQCQQSDHCAPHCAGSSPSSNPRAATRGGAGA